MKNYMFEGIKRNIKTSEPRSTFEIPLDRLVASNLYFGDANIHFVLCKTPVRTLLKRDMLNNLYYIILYIRNIEELLCYRSFN